MTPERARALQQRTAMARLPPRTVRDHSGKRLREAVDDVLDGDCEREDLAADAEIERQSVACTRRSCGGPRARWVRTMRHEKDDARRAPVRSVHDFDTLKSRILDGRDTSAAAGGEVNERPSGCSSAPQVRSACFGAGCRWFESSPPDHRARRPSRMRGRRTVAGLHQRHGRKQGFPHEPPSLLWLTVFARPPPACRRQR